MCFAIFPSNTISVKSLFKVVNLDSGKLGYDADLIPANLTAYNKLPACCKKDAPKH